MRISDWSSDVCSSDLLTGELVDGPTHDFNLMWRRDAVAAGLLHRPLVGPMVFFAEPGTTWALHLLAGEARFDAASGLPLMQAGATALLVEPRQIGRAHV